MGAMPKGREAHKQERKSAAVRCFGKSCSHHAFEGELPTVNKPGSRADRTVHDEGRNL